MPARPRHPPAHLSLEPDTGGLFRAAGCAHRAGGGRAACDRVVATRSPAGAPRRKADLLSSAAPPTLLRGSQSQAQVGRLVSPRKPRATKRSPGPGPWLEELVLDDFVIVPHARLELSPELNVLTGETGTGKSILLEAVALLLGGRGTATLIRRGARRLRVAGTFRILPKSAAGDRLAELGRPAQEERLIVVREIRREGGSRCAVNGEPVLVTELARLGGILAEIHGPGEHQQLLKEEELRARVDRFGGLESDLERLGKLRAAWAGARETRRELEERIRRVTEQEDWLRFQLQEIRTVDLDAGARRELEEEVAGRRRRRARAELLSFLEARLYSAEGSVVEILESCDDALSRADQAAEPDEIADRLGSLRTEARALARQVQELLGRVDPREDESVEGLEERLEAARRLERKLRCDWDAVLERGAAIEDDLEMLAAGQERLEELAAEEQAAAGRYRTAARKLHDRRRRAAAALTEALRPHLGEVGWNRDGLQLGVEWDEPEAGEEPGPVGPPWGWDRVAGRAETNPGEGWRPFQDVVSHGELSRLHLALLTLQMGRDDPRISIFDEVDMGIGGETARRVAAKLMDLSRHRQVILVTHLASLASRAHRHFRVTKAVADGRTRARVEPLEPEERITEVARMLAGARDSAAARAHARELLQSGGDPQA
ncbi:MAG: hypothetical protein GF355_14810 [Candidatus Eisenbacteria bacterium]|nr:hypothetical protein [Candidatus Eisenbacteria bacterium]